MGEWFIHEPRKIPVVLSPDEVAHFLEAAPGIKYKAALSVAYGAGLRVSEVVALKASDIDSKRMMLRVEQGKGRKDRHAMLSPVLLNLLRDWYRIARPQGAAECLLAATEASQPRYGKLRLSMAFAPAKDGALIICS
jgi:integrase